MPKRSSSSIDNGEDASGNGLSEESFGSALRGGARQDYSSDFVGTPNVAYDSALEFHHGVLSRAVPLPRPEQQELLRQLDGAIERGLKELSRQPIFVIEIQRQLALVSSCAQDIAQLRPLFSDDKGAQELRATKPETYKVARRFLKREGEIALALASTKEEFERLIRNKGALQANSPSLRRFEARLDSLASIIDQSGMNRSFRAISGFSLIWKKREELNQIAEQGSKRDLAEFEKSILMPAALFVRSTQAICEEVPDLKARVVVHNMRLIPGVAKSFARYGVSMEDLMQEGYVGLMRAADKFDPSRGFQFSTYAVWWIRLGCLRAIHSQAQDIKVPPHRWDEMLREKRLFGTLAQQLGREPTFNERAQAFGVSPKELEELTGWFRPMISMDAERRGGDLNGDKPRSMQETIADPNVVAADDRVLGSITGSFIQELLSEAQLSFRDREILTRRYLNEPGETLQTIGDDLGLSRERVRQLEHLALKRLLSVVKARGLSLESLF